MRKVIVSMNITLDGFIAGPDDELDWHFNYWDDEMTRCFSEQLSETDTIILGRVTYSAMAGFWSLKSKDLSMPREDLAFAEMMNSHTKVVFTKTLTQPAWHNSHFIKDSLKKTVLTLKRQPGKHMIVYGSGLLVSSLMKLGLVDEYILWLHPVLLGRGISFFKKQGHPPDLKLLRTRTFNSGVVALYYKTGHATYA